LADSSLIQRKIFATVPLDETLYSQLPEKQKALSLLGTPFKRYRNPGVRSKEQFIYKFRARGKGSPLITARLYYSEEDLLKKLEISWGDMKVEIVLKKTP